MNDALLARLLELPPDLDQPADRFDLVRRRVERRRRRVAAATVAAVVAVGVGVPVALAVTGDDSTRTTDEIATDPPSTAPTTVPSTAAPTTSAPVAAGPGTDEVVHLAEPVVTDGTGTVDIDLGPRPDGATGVATGSKCLAAGRVSYPGFYETCPGPEDTPGPARVDRFSVIDLPAGVDQLAIRAKPDHPWQIATVWVRIDFTPAPVNANGQTYGPMNEHGTPDLVAVRASNGKDGYAYADDYQDPRADEPYPVYLSDGETQVGTFDPR